MSHLHGGRNTVTIVGIAALLWLSAAAQADQLYRWVDENGQVHFGDRPPAAAKAEDIEGELRPVNSAAATVPQQSAAAGGQQAKLQREYQNRQQQRQSRQQQQMARACQRARRELSILRGRVYFVDEQGKEIKMTERERQRQAEQLQREIGRVCG